MRTLLTNVWVTALTALAFAASAYYIHQKVGLREFPGILLVVITAAVAALVFFRLLRLLPMTQSAAHSNTALMEIRKSKRVELAVTRYVDDPSARITCVHLIPVESALRASGVSVAPASQAVYRGSFANTFEMELKARTVMARAMLNFPQLQATIPLAASVSFQLPMDDEYYERIQKPDPMLHCAACDSSIRFAVQSDIHFPA